MTKSTSKGLNDMTLTPQLLADLYSNVLIQSNTSVVPVKAPVKFLGKNEKKILVVVNKSEAAYLPEEELNFFTNVLTACKLALNDVAIVNWYNCSADGEELLHQLKSNHIILIDVTPESFGLPVNFPLYQVQSVNGKTFVHTPSLSEIEKDKEQKKLLWSALIRLFNL